MRPPQESLHSNHIYIMHILLPHFMHIVHLPLTYVLDRLQLPPLKTEVAGELTALVMTTIVVNESCQSG